eukprot:TRINITY_DN510_c0_g1_i1.p2 TRINITY_DN510_c0_g1~~TRINITY_DN510_c0_g1_i1.p2  ORF type:complete len:1087 (-),score=108.26 TRINITY_DN510_c0_g1_i1:5556-8816(-)
MSTHRQHRNSTSAYSQRTSTTATSRVHESDRNRSRDREARQYGGSTLDNSHRRSSHRHAHAELLKRGGATPLIFKGTEGATLESRIVPTPAEEAKVRLKTGLHKDIIGESGMYAGGHFDLENDYVAFEWEENEKEIDRAWYDCDEVGNVMYGNDQYDLQGGAPLPAAEGAEKQRLKLRQPVSRRAANNAESDKWDLHQLKASGVVKVIEPADGALELEEEEGRVIVQVHDIKPPFLDSSFVYTKQTQPIQIVRDPTSDMAKLAKQGSNILRYIRERNDRAKMREKFWELAGSKLGNILKIEKKPDPESEDATKYKDDGTIDYKADNKYAALLKKKTAAASDFARSKSLREQRDYLPINSVKKELLSVIRDNKIVVIVGETGSGKTTQITQYLYEAGYGDYGQIGCTQPRRVAAVSVAKRVAEETGTDLGNKVGYAIRFEDCTSNETIIKYMTDGVLLRESLNDPELEKYSVVIMDEAHERSLNTDVLFGILRKVATKRRDIKIIITSATMNSEKFAAFFGEVPIFNIPGRTFPVETYFTKTPVEDYVDSAVQKAIQTHIQQPPGDILIFMTGQEDIEATCVLIAERLSTMEGVPTMLVLPIYSQLPSDVQARIFEVSKQRKCIVATNIAETSLTLDGVRYVIDTGYCKLKVYNPRIGMDALQITPISQASANQRAGRAGRTGPGVCYRLYTDVMFRSEMYENTIPEIQRTNLANVVLLLKSLNVDNLLEFDFMDPPPQETLLNSMYQLWVLGALDNTGDLTALGRKMVEFPLDPPLSKMLILSASEEYKCSSEILTIVSMLSVPAIFFRPKDRESESDAAREKFFVPESDHLTLLNVYQQWQINGHGSEWASKYFMNVKALRKVREVRAQLQDIMKTLGLDEVSSGTEWDVVRKVICSGYFHNAAKMKGIGEYLNLRTGIPCVLHPSSAIYSLGYTPEYVVYHEVVMTTKEYMQVVTAIDPRWLAELGPMFFTIRESYEVSTTALREAEREEKEKIERQMTEARKAIEERKEKQKTNQEIPARRMKTDIILPGKFKTPRRTTPRIRYGLEQANSQMSCTYSYYCYISTINQQKYIGINVNAYFMLS